MTTRLIDLVVLVAEMSQADSPALGQLDSELARKGYSAREIEDAMFWYASRDDAAAGVSRVGPSVRVLSDFERMSLSTECYGYLLRLLNLGIVGLEAFERIVTRAVPVGPEKVELADVKAIACDMIFGGGDEGVLDEGCESDEPELF